MKFIGSEKLIYAFSPDNHPAAVVDLDELFLVDCPDCYSGQIRTSADLRPNIDTSIMDASTGPIAVPGVRAGETIKVRVHDLFLAESGVMVTAPGLGPLGEFISEPDTKIIRIEKGLAVFSDTIRLPLTPMIGVLGVAPAEGSVHCAIPGDHGGNMDTKDIRPGNSVYFTSFVDGANLALADFHACMGDGELSGTGIEIAGKALLSVSKVPGVKIRTPVIETPSEFMVVVSGEDFAAVSKRAVKESVDLISSYHGISLGDGYRLLSATCDLRISQIVNERITLRMVIPKSILGVLPQFC